MREAVADRRGRRSVNDDVCHRQYVVSDMKCFGSSCTDVMPPVPRDVVDSNSV